MPNRCTINHPTTLHTQWNPVTHCCLLMATCAAGCIPQKSCHLSTLSHPGFPSVTILSASSKQTLAFIEMKYSRLPDLSVILKYQPPVYLDYRARNRPRLIWYSDPTRIENYFGHSVWYFSLPFGSFLLYLLVNFFNAFPLWLQVPSLSLYIPYLVLLTAMCMAKNGRQMMSHLTLKATPLLHTVHVQTQCTVEDFPILSFAKI